MFFAQQLRVELKDALVIGRDQPIGDMQAIDAVIRMITSAPPKP